ncbi:MAG: hypothetical protein ACI4KJ_00355 [Anaerovoracaceae bacterium]
MRRLIWAIYGRAYILINDIRRPAREAVIILKYACRNGFPSGDDEYERIIKEAMQVEQ